MELKVIAAPTSYKRFRVVAVKGGISTPVYYAEQGELKPVAFDDSVRANYLIYLVENLLWQVDEYPHVFIRSSPDAPTQYWYGVSPTDAWWNKYFCPDFDRSTMPGEEQRRQMFEGFERGFAEWTKPGEIVSTFDTPVAQPPSDVPGYSEIVPCSCNGKNMPSEEFFEEVAPAMPGSYEYEKEIKAAAEQERARLREKRKRGAELTPAEKAWLYTLAEPIVDASPFPNKPNNPPAPKREMPVTPFTPEQQKVWDALDTAHKAFERIPSDQLHAKSLQDWGIHLRGLQCIIENAALRSLWPNLFK